MDALTQLVSQASDFLWNVVLIIILCGTGIYYTIRLKFIQVRKFREGWHQVFGNFSLSGKNRRDDILPVCGDSHRRTGRNR